MVNYSNSKIYKIEPICDHDEGDIYIGSTTKKYLSQRLEFHRRDYKNYKSGMIKYKLTSFTLFDKYGIDNCDIILLEFVNATCKEELHRIEAHYIKSVRCVNKMVPLRTKKEYKEDNKELIKETSKKYYQDNIEHFLEKINCECGSSISRTHISRHYKTQVHLDYLNDHKIQLKKSNMLVCECGSELEKLTSKHLKTKKHIEFIKSKTELEI